MKYLVEIKDNGIVVESKEFKSVKEITEALQCTAAAVNKNFKCRYNPDEKKSKKISQKIFDSKYNIICKM
jgi:hypothetical protein